MTNNVKLTEEIKKIREELYNSEPYREIIHYSDEELLEEYRHYRRVNSGFYPTCIDVEDEFRFNFILIEIKKRNLTEKKRELIDFYVKILDEEDKEICSFCEQNKGNWLFSCDRREVVFCEACLKNREGLLDNCFIMVPDVPQN